MGLPLLWALAAAAFAQAPPGLTASLTSGLTAGSPNTRWIAAPEGATEVASVRFFGETVAGPSFKSGEEVELIVVDGDMARIHEGTRYGWVAASTLAASPPLTLPPLGSLPALAPPGGNPLLGGLAPLAPPAPLSPPAPVAPSPAPPAP